MLLVQEAEALGKKITESIISLRRETDLVLQLCKGRLVGVTSPSTGGVNSLKDMV